MIGRDEVFDADAEVTRHLDAVVVVEAFRLWRSLFPQLRSYGGNLEFRPRLTSRQSSRKVGSRG
jgi:hypothetical protein